MINLLTAEVNQPLEDPSLLSLLLVWSPILLFVALLLFVMLKGKR